MASAAVPRRAAAVAGVAVALTAGASSGLVAADLEHHLAMTTTAIASVDPGPTAQPSPTSTASVPVPSPTASESLTPAPAPRNGAPGQQPHTTTRAS